MFAPADHDMLVTHGAAVLLAVPRPSFIDAATNYN
jgi:hypothetical protein